MLKQIVPTCLTALSLYSCIGQSNEKAFLDKYEFEDFSQFKNVSVFIRGQDIEKNPIVMVNAPSWVNDNAKTGLYVITLDKTNYQIINTKWTLTEGRVNADTVMIQQLAQTFMQYNISGLKVDEGGNVFAYLNDAETLSLVRFNDINETQKEDKKVKWIKNRHNWYRP